MNKGRPCYSKAIILLGQGKNGKTCTAENLKSRKFTYNSPRTVGMDLIKTSINDIPVCIFDYAGQITDMKVYYQHIKTIEDGIVLLVYNMELTSMSGELNDYYKATINEWLQYAEKYLPNCPIIMVGTHASKWPTPAPVNQLQETYKNIVGGVTVENTDATGIDELKEILTEHLQTVKEIEVIPNNIMHVKEAAALIATSSTNIAWNGQMPRPQYVKLVQEANTIFNLSIEPDEIMKYLESCNLAWQDDTTVYMPFTYRGQELDVVPFFPHAKFKLTSEICIAFFYQIPAVVQKYFVSGDKKSIFVSRSKNDILIETEDESILIHMTKRYEEIFFLTKLKSDFLKEVILLILKSLKKEKIFETIKCFARCECSKCNKKLQLNDPYWIQLEQIWAMKKASEGMGKPYPIYCSNLGGMIDYSG